MPPEDRDLAYLWDMLEAARTVRELVAGVPREDYLTDRKLQLAVERAIEIIGEAARRVSESFRCDHPELPWRAMIRQRHVLAHEYGEINQERIWNVATERVTELITLLEPLVPAG